jgi:SH3-like domain-containing protein
MHAQPQRTLKRLLKQYGQELIDDPRRTEALLRDLCGQHTREIFVLVNAQKQRVPNDLLTAPAWMPRQATYSRLSRLLQTKLALTEDAADWAVAAWAAALDLDSPPKGENWSWMPAQLRAPASPSSRKPRSKKRQKSHSGIQYRKEAARPSTSSGSMPGQPRQQVTRAMLADRGWRLPKIPLSLPTSLWQGPIAWAAVLPWVALVTATIFMFAVLYWTSSLRSDRIAATEATQEATPSVQSENGAALPAAAEQRDALQLAASPSAYLTKLIPLPTWANVNVVTLNIRQAPALNSDVLDFLPEGAPVHVIAFSEDGRWSQIERPRSGWVSNEFLLFQSQDATLTSIRLNVHPRRTQPYAVEVRAAPRLDAEVTETLPPGTVVVVATLIGEPATWYQIADPAIGWIAANDLVPASP